MGQTFGEPFKAFRFLVQVEGSQTISAAFSQFSGVKMHVDMPEIRTGANISGVSTSVPGLTHFENVTLTKGVVGDNDFLDWIFSVMPRKENPPTGGRNISRTINVIALDDKGKPGVTWSLLGATPVSYELAPLDGSQSALMSESMEFSINGVDRVTHAPSQSK